MGATPNITLTATLQDLMGEAVGSTANPAKLSIALCGFGPLLPCVIGAAMIARPGPVYIESTDGTISFSLWGNDQITPTGTYYSVAVLDGQGNVVQCGAYQFTGSGSQDLSDAVPIVPPYGFPAGRLKMAMCTGAVPGTVYVAPGSPVAAVFYNGILLAPSYYSLSFETITLTFTTESGDTINALCVV